MKGYCKGISKGKDMMRNKGKGRGQVIKAKHEEGDVGEAYLREYETGCMGQMGKWYSAVSDFRKGQSMQKKPPLFKKLFAAGSVEEEALALLIHEKKIMEMEKELQALLNFRFGYGTWDELKEMQRKIRADREKQFYNIKERQRAIIEGISIVLLLTVMAGIIFGILYLIGVDRGLF